VIVQDERGTNRIPTLPRRRVRFRWVLSSHAISVPDAFDSVSPIVASRSNVGDTGGK
jgi:hypothetical protein